MFRSRAVAKQPQTDLDRPFRLITAPAGFGLIIGTVAAAAGLLWLFGGQMAVKVTGAGLLVNPPGNVSVFAPVGGTLADGLLPVGAEVRAGDVLATVTALDGQEVSVVTPIDGTVVSLSTAVWAQVSAGAPLVAVAPDTGPMIGVMFLPVAAIHDVEVGMRAESSPSTTDLSSDGFLIGTVAHVDALPATIERLQLIFGNDGVVEALVANGPVQEVVIEYERDASAPLGLKWSGTGPDDPENIQSGSTARSDIVLRTQTPWQAFTGG